MVSVSPSIYFNVINLDLRVERDMGLRFPNENPLIVAFYDVITDMIYKYEEGRKILGRITALISDISYFYDFFNSLRFHFKLSSEILLYNEEKSFILFRIGPYYFNSAWIIENDSYVFSIFIGFDYFIEDFDNVFIIQNQIDLSVTYG